MGGRGSGGSRSGGGASANPPRLVSPSQYYQEKYRVLTHFPDMTQIYIIINNLS